MRGYERDDYEDLDEYEEDEEQEEEDGEEEYEEKEAPPPTREELEYLELRQRLKESIRKQMKKDSGSTISQEKRNKLPSDNYGSFFGPSRPVIAQRVIQESKSLLENQHLAAKVSKLQNAKNKSFASISAGSKPRVSSHAPKVVNELKKKVEKLKDTRDYSFLLSDNAELPVPTKNPQPRNVSAPHSEAQAPPRSKQLLSNNGRQVSNSREERKPISTSSRLQPKGSSQNLASASKPNQTLVDSRKKLGSNHGNGPGRPTVPKSIPSKTPAVSMVKKIPAPSAKSYTMVSAHRPTPSKLHSSAPKEPLERKRQFQEPSKGKLIPKQPVPSAKLQMSRPPPSKISSRASMEENRPKKKPVRRRYSDDEDGDDDANAISMIRRMFGYNPNKYAGRDDGDDSDMEANFDDILKEESRSAKIARMEDEEELRKIEEEERRERLRKEAKRRKLSQR